MTHASPRWLPLAAVIAVCAVTLLPFLGLTEFTTKGEPREAVVALSMIEGHNWVLPVNNGGDIPYKPPFMHYFIALFSLLTGHVSEYTSRLPSALSLMAMCTGLYAFLARRKSVPVAFLTVMLLLTSFEVHRAGVNCRVDMVLTACTVGAMLLLYRWREGGHRGLPLWAVLCMSGAVMSKGPVGMVLPCLVMGVYSLLRGDRFWPTFGRYVVVGLLSCVLPAVWYVAAWHQGGQPFLDLVLEENVGRMTGTMSYDSHEHAWPYNFFTLITGWLPWTLLVLCSLAVLPWKRYVGEGVRRLPCLKKMAAVFARIREADALQVFIWTMLTVVFVFYCLPASKRSVYLLPCYPALAFLLAEYMVWLTESRRAAAVRVYAVVMASVSLVLTAALVAVRLGMVPGTVFHGRHAAENVAMMRALSDTPLTWWRLFIVALPAVVAVGLLVALCKKSTRGDRRVLVSLPVALLLTLFVALDGFYQPVVMNVKTLRPMAEQLQRRYSAEPVYSYLSIGMLHFFGADFYSGDRIGDFERQRPARGVLLIADRDRGEFFARHRRDYTFVPDGDLGDTYNEMRQTVYAYRFARSSMK